MIKNKLVFSIIVISLLLVSTYYAGLESSSSVKATTSSAIVATDPANDIFVFNYNNGSLFSYLTGQSKPVIDILSLSYGLDTNSNATVTLTLGATPTPSNETFYFVEFSNATVFGILWSGAYDNSSSSNGCATSCEFISVNGNFSVEYSNAVISGNNITWTLPSWVTAINTTDYTFYNTSSNMPATPDSSWVWDAITWTGTFPYSTSGNTTNESGTWYEDTLDTGTLTTPTSGTGTSGTGTSGTTGTGTTGTGTTGTGTTGTGATGTGNTGTSSTGTGTGPTGSGNSNTNSGNQSSSTNSTSKLSLPAPGFDFIPVLGILTLSSIVAIIERRRKNLN